MPDEGADFPDAVDEMFGDSVSYHRTGRVSDSEGGYSGRAAADTAALHGHREVTAESAARRASDFDPYRRR
jgi:hypothetical protein